MEDLAVEAVADVLLAVVEDLAVDGQVVVMVVAVPVAVAVAVAVDLVVEDPAAGLVRVVKAPAAGARAAAAGIVVRGLMAAEIPAATASSQQN